MSRREAQDQSPPANTRYFIVGDIHGCFDELLELLNKAGYNKGGFELLLAGDLINKGPKSFEVISWVRSRGVRSVIGNHELKFLESCRSGVPLSEPLAQLRKQMGSELEDWLMWMDQLPHYIETESFILVHGGLVPGEHPKDSERSLLANIRRWNQEASSLSQSFEDPAWYELYHGEKPVVYGHWAMQGLTLRDQCIGLDTGCVYGKKLSGVFMPERKILQVKAAKTYTKIT